MSKFFVLISHHKQDDRDPFYLQVQLPDKKLSIGWGEINPINQNYKEIYKLIMDFYPDFAGTTNPDNGAKSLPVFCDFVPGDVIFVRGNAKILDVVVITGNPFYDSYGHDGNDYRLKVQFTPLFPDKHSIIKTIDLGNIYDAVIREGGYTRVMFTADCINGTRLCSIRLSKVHKVYVLMVGIFQLMVNCLF